MNNIQLALLILVIAAISVLFSFMGNLSSYESIKTARENPGKFVHLVVSLDLDGPVDYDPIKNPNHLSFYAKDSTGEKIRVVYQNSKPENFEHSDKLVLKGRITDDLFNCEEILMKCPSKYKDENMKASKPGVPAEL